MRQEASIERTSTGAPLGLGDASMLDAALSSRTFWKELCETVGDMMFETDRSGRICFLSPAIVLGYPSHNLVGHLASDLLCEAGLNPFAAGRPVRMQHVWFRRADGVPALVALSARPLASGGMRGIGIDVTETAAVTRNSAAIVAWRAMLDRVVSRMREEVLTPQILQAGLSEAADCLGAEGAAIVVATPVIANQGIPTQARTEASDLSDAAGSADAVTRLHGVGRGWDEIAPHLRLPPALACVPRQEKFTGTAAGRDLMFCSNHARLGPPSALVLWRRDREGWRDDEHGFADAVAAALRDVMEQDSIQRRITEQARTDILTGLLTRRCFLTEARRRFDRLDRAREPATLISIDIEAFGAFNQAHGDEEGDLALCHVAAFLRDMFRPTDLVCRIAGDHFAAWLDGADMFAAAERAESLCQHGVDLLVAGEPVRLSLSVGLASRVAESLEDMESLLRRADDARQLARRSGTGLWRASQLEIET